MSRVYHDHKKWCPVKSGQYNKCNCHAFGVKCQNKNCFVEAKYYKINTHVFSCDIHLSDGSWVKYQNTTKQDKIGRDFKIVP